MQDRAKKHDYQNRIKGRDSMKKKSKIDFVMYGIVKTAMAEQKPKHEPGITGWKEYNFPLDKGVRFMTNMTAAIRIYKPLPDELSAAETGLAVEIVMRFLGNETNMLCYRSDREYIPLRAKKIAKRINKSASHIYRLIAKLCRLRVLAREQGRLYVNPCYFFRGRYLSYHLYYLFKPELSAVLPAWVVKRYEGNIHA